MKRGYVDDRRVGVTGGSGGGLLTNWLICQSNRFAAAATQRCVTDWAQMYWSADFALFQPFWFRKPPYEDPAEWSERSPLHFIDKVETPLMILHSEEDWRTPIAQGEVMFRALKYWWKPVVMMRFPGESHELSGWGTVARAESATHPRVVHRWLMKPAPQAASRTIGSRQSTPRSMSPRRVTPQSAIAVSNSRRRISTTRVTPWSPAAASPHR